MAEERLLRACEGAMGSVYRPWTIRGTTDTRWGVCDPGPVCYFQEFNDRMARYNYYVPSYCAHHRVCCDDLDLTEEDEEVSINECLVCLLRCFDKILRHNGFSSLRNMMCSEECQKKLDQLAQDNKRGCTKHDKKLKEEAVYTDVNDEEVNKNQNMYGDRLHLMRCSVLSRGIFCNSCLRCLFQSFSDVLEEFKHPRLDALLGCDKCEGNTEVIADRTATRCPVHGTWEEHLEFQQRTVEDIVVASAGEEEN